MIDQILIFILLLLLFIAGILFDRYVLLGHSVSIDKSKSFFDKQKDLKSTTTIDINSDKIVLGVNTDGLSGGPQELGATVKTKNDTQLAINKLKNMKGR